MKPSSIREQRRSPHTFHPGSPPLCRWSCETKDFPYPLVNSTCWNQFIGIFSRFFLLHSRVSSFYRWIFQWTPAPGFGHIPVPLLKQPETPLPDIPIASRRYFVWLGGVAKGCFVGITEPPKKTGSRVSRMVSWHFSDKDGELWDKPGVSCIFPTRFPGFQGIIGIYGWGWFEVPDMLLDGPNLLECWNIESWSPVLILIWYDST
jgi:hypothetical protein